MKWFTTRRRGYMYRVCMAGGAVALFYGIVSAQEVVVWGGAIATVLMVSPVANTPTDKPTE